MKYDPPDNHKFADLMLLTVVGLLYLQDISGWNWKIDGKCEEII